MKRDSRSPPPEVAETDPYPAWREARSTCPVQPIEFFGAEGFQVVCRGEVDQVLRDGDTFSSGVNQKTMGPYMGRVILGMDGKRHSAYRSLVSSAFRTSALARWEHELIAPTIHAALDAIAPQGRGELVRDVTSIYPMKVIAGIIGVPVEQHARFMAWAQDINQGPVAHEPALAASRAMREYLEPIVEDRRRNPRDDFISDIVTAEIEGERLDDEDIMGFLRLLMPAGAETTFRAMGNCLYALLTHPADLERVREDRSLLPRAIEETLRWETSVTMVNREATCPVELEGVAIPEGASLLVATGSANRDESRYAHPDEWDLDREEQPHLAFGWGRHLCLGMHLARLEMRVGIGAVLDRLPGLRLDPDREPPRIVGYHFRGPDSLPVRFEAGSARPG